MWSYAQATSSMYMYYWLWHGNTTRHLPHSALKTGPQDTVIISFYGNMNGGCAHVAWASADLDCLTLSGRLTEDEFNYGYKMYKLLKELLQPMGETQFMRLTREYCTLSYRNYGNISEFLDHIKLSEEQIDATKVTMPPDKQPFLYLSMALWEVEHFRS